MTRSLNIQKCRVGIDDSDAVMNKHNTFKVKEYVFKVTVKQSIRVDNNWTIS